MKNVNEIVMKTNFRGFRNVVVDNVVKLEKQIRKVDAQSEEAYQDYSIAFLYGMCRRMADESGKFSVTNIRFGKFDERLYSFDLKLNIEDADVVLRVSNFKGNMRGQLFMGGYFSRSLHCANGAFPVIAGQLYDCVVNVGVAA